MSTASTKAHAEEVLKLMKKNKAQKSKSVKVEMTTEQRNAKVLQMLEEGIKVKEVAKRLNITPGLVYQIKSQMNKSVEQVEVKSLREKDINLTHKELKSAIVDVVEDKPTIDIPIVNDSLKKQNLDLQKQLDRFREIEKNMQLELIEQKHKYEKLLAAERVEKEKAYADYSSEVENSNRFRQQVQDLLMVDGLNEGLMQQNLMFRKRFGMMQEGVQL
ncbi:helix-turn-helix domain-containing protein [Psychrobacillus sp. FSL K6-1267]|uniref:helix-turn-helix domain-containing protein n=1 Tax=Psychrobacillus sp. FSL K6-1267 TaxID=2921543 RepID=UPI0030FC11BD